MAAAFQSRIIASAVDVIDRRGPSNEMRRQLQLNKTKVRLYWPSSKRRLTRPSLLTIRSASVLKVGVLHDAKIAKCFASYSQRRLRKGCIVRLYSSKRRFSCPSLLTRRSALVLKVGVSYLWRNV